MPMILQPSQMLPYAMPVLVGWVLYRRVRRNTEVGEGAEIGAHCVVEGACLGSGSRLDPLSWVRAGKGSGTHLP